MKTREIKQIIQRIESLATFDSLPYVEPQPLTLLDLARASVVKFAHTARKPSLAEIEQDES
jgi:hypothetical protein